MKNIIVNLAKNMERTENIHQWEPLPFDEYLKKDETTKAAVRLSRLAELERY